VVIAGDPKQLPPTRFFESSVVGSEEEEPETEQELFDQINDNQRTMSWINKNGPGPNGH